MHVCPTPRLINVTHFNGVIPSIVDQILSQHRLRRNIGAIGKHTESYGGNDERQFSHTGFLRRRINARSNIRAPTYIKSCELVAVLEAGTTIAAAGTFTAA